MRPDDQPAFLAAVLHVLRLAAHHREGMDFAALADLGNAGDDGVRMDLDAVAEGDVGADDRKRADFDAAAQFRARIDRRQGVNRCLSHGGHSLRAASSACLAGSTIMALISASATIWPFTLALPSKRQTRPRLRSLVI